MSRGGPWPTLRASDWKGVGPLGSKSHKHRLDRGYLDAALQDAEGKTGKIGIAWAESLMGFPKDWTLIDGPLDEEPPPTPASPTG